MAYWLSTISPICGCCALKHLLDEPVQMACNAKIEGAHNVCCSECYLGGDEHYCFVLGPIGELQYKQVTKLKSQGRKETFDKHLKVFLEVLIDFFNRADTVPRLSAWTLTPPVAEFGGCPHLVHLFDSADVPTPSPKITSSDQETAPVEPDYVHCDSACDLDPESEPEDEDEEWVLVGPKNS